MKLLIDIGNTRVKPALADGTLLVALAPIAHGDPGWTDALHAELARLDDAVDSVWIADVARAAVGDAVRDACTRRFPHARVETPTTPVRACGVTNAYAEPARLGIDRFLALVAAHVESDGPKLVASLGTALTVDALHADGRHRGGLIAPAPELMRAALLGATAKIAPMHEGAIADFGTSTEDGVASGCWNACAALVERAASRFEAECGQAVRVLLAGGSAGRLARLLERSVEVPDLVLRGLARFAETR